MAISPADITTWHLTRDLPNNIEEKLSDHLKETARKASGHYIAEVYKSDLEKILGNVSQLDMFSLLERFKNKGWIVEAKTGYYLFSEVPNLVN